VRELRGADVSPHREAIESLEKILFPDPGKRPCAFCAGRVDSKSTAADGRAHTPACPYWTFFEDGGSL
jgi:hypothetical protein